MPRHETPELLPISFESDDIEELKEKAQEVLKLHPDETLKISVRVKAHTFEMVIDKSHYPGHLRIKNCDGEVVMEGSTKLLQIYVDWLEEDKISEWPCTRVI